MIRSSRVALVALAILVLLAGCGESRYEGPAVFVVGFDGMEPTLLEAEMDAGRMPHFSALAREGGYSKLGTTLPPESPVAWATFNTGLDAGGHGIFDFIHRETVPNGIKLYQATARSRPPGDFVSLFGYRFPTDAGGTDLLVKGRFFWEHLADRGIPATIYRVPSNYPPRETGARTFPGMGTPDLLGSYGVFAYYTDDPPLNTRDIRKAGAAHVIVLERATGPIETVLRGPRNLYAKPETRRVGRPAEPPYTTVPFRIYPDAERGCARIDVDEETVVLPVGGWSDWVPVSFPMVPGVLSASGMVRIHLKEVTPHLRVYVSPVNADPLSPEIPLSTPEDACVKLAKSIGRYYTQGMAEDTQANRYEVLDLDEFLVQAELVLEERLKMLEHELERFRRTGGFTFFYFSSTDLNAHMLYRYMDEEHLLYTEEGAKKYGGKLFEIYRRMDEILGHIRESLPEDTRIVVISDHGFKSYRRQVSLNTWLYENGFLALRNEDDREGGSGFTNVDWTRTKAYAVGFSGIHLNIRGREKPGLLREGSETEEVKRQIIEGLESLIDEHTGLRPVKKVHRRENVYHGPEVTHAPDLIVGFDLYYGCSDDSVLGGVPEELIGPVTDAWSGSHLMDPSVVPGILLVNRPILVEDPGLIDLAPSILGEFGIEAPEMQGRKVW